MGLGRGPALRAVGRRRGGYYEDGGNAVGKARVANPDQASMATAGPKRTARSPTRRCAPMARTKYATSARAVRRPSWGRRSPSRSPVTAELLTRTKRGRNHGGRRSSSNSAANQRFGMASYRADKIKDPASPRTTRVDEAVVRRTVGIVERRWSDQRANRAPRSAVGRAWPPAWSRCSLVGR
jgi:hypothetical protein